MENPDVVPYLHFGGRCEEALNFYKETVGARIDMLMRYRESPEAIEVTLPPDWDDKVLHANFHVGNAPVMASDDVTTETTFGGFSLCVCMPSEEEAKRVFAALSEGGSVTMPLGPTFWSPCFGMLTDRFGVGWMVTIPDPAG